MTKRRAAIGRAAWALGLDALLVTQPADVRYLCGFTGSSGALLLRASTACLFTDGRYTEQAREEVGRMRVVIAKSPVLVAACKAVEAAGVGRCGYDPAHTTVAALSAMRAALEPRNRRSLFQPASNLVSRRREIKDSLEIATMREAAALGDTVFEVMVSELDPAMTEVQVALTIEQRARSAGAERMSFESIVAGGTHSALPHARPTLTRLPRRGFLTLDFGLVLRGYCSDMTRTVHFGRPSAEARAVYDFVLEAQKSAVACVGPGVEAGMVDEAARGVLRRAKLERFFSHSTGHGVGLEIHEQPRIAVAQKQRLEHGMIVTIEPGVYLAGRYGIRIEDMVLVTESGHEVLTTSPTTLIEL